MSSDFHQSLLSAGDSASHHPTYHSTISPDPPPPPTTTQPHHLTPTSSLLTPTPPPSSSSLPSHYISIPPSVASAAVDGRPPPSSSSLVPLYPLTSTSPAASVPRHLHYRLRAFQLPPYPVYPTLSSQWSALSRLSQVFLVALPLLYPLTFVWASTRLLACFLPLLLLPSLLFYHLFRTRYATHAELNLLLTTYALGFTVAALLVLLVETAIAVLAAIPLLYDQLPHLLDVLTTRTKEGTPADPNEVLSAVEPTIGFYLLIFILAYVSAGGCEEGMKYMLVNRVKRITPGFRDREGYLLYAVAGALGFSTVENIGYAFNTLTPWYAVLIGVLTRLLISTPIHVACAYLVGVGVVRREVYGEPLMLWRLLLVPVLLHGSFDFCLMIASVALDPEGVALLVVECVIVVVTAVALVAAIRVERRHIAGPPPPVLPVTAEAGRAGQYSGMLDRQQGRGEGEMAVLV